MNPTITIITVNLNNCEGMKKTMSSVFSQTSKDFEYIVIDGASTDGSAEQIKNNEEKIAYWISEPDTGIYQAMNKGIRKAKGKYLQFLNSGDTLVNETVIETIVRTIPDCSIFYGNMLKKLKGRGIYYNKEIDIDSFLTFYRGSLNHSPAFIKKELFDKYGLFDEKYKIVSDWKFFLIAVCLNKEPIRYSDLDISCFDMSGISSTDKTLDRKERREVLKEYFPESVLYDYDKYWFQIEQSNRINKFWITRSFFWFVERVLFKFEKMFRA